MAPTAVVAAGEPSTGSIGAPTGHVARLRNFARNREEVIEMVRLYRHRDNVRFRLDLANNLCDLYDVIRALCAQAHADFCEITIEQLVLSHLYKDAGVLTSGSSRHYSVWRWLRHLERCGLIHVEQVTKARGKPVATRIKLLTEDNWICVMPPAGIEPASHAMQVCGRRRETKKERTERSVRPRRRRAGRLGVGRYIKPMEAPKTSGGGSQDPGNPALSPGETVTPPAAPGPVSDSQAVAPLFNSEQSVPAVAGGPGDRPLGGLTPGLPSNKVTAYARGGPDERGQEAASDDLRAGPPSSSELHSPEGAPAEPGRSDRGGALPAWLADATAFAADIGLPLPEVWITGALVARLEAAGAILDAYGQADVDYAPRTDPHPAPMPGHRLVALQELMEQTKADIDAGRSQARPRHIGYWEPAFRARAERAKHIGASAKKVARRRLGISAPPRWPDADGNREPGYKGTPGSRPPSKIARPKAKSVRRRGRPNPPPSLPPGHWDG